MAMKNETFYVVVATIIPVYFLGLTLQGAFYEKFQQYVESGIKERDAVLISWLRKSVESGRRFARRDITDDEAMKLVIGTYRTEFIKIMSIFVVIVVVWPTFGELVALIALSNNKASLWQNIVVESSAFLLVIATASIILARLYAPYYMFIFRVTQLGLSFSALSRRSNPNHESSASSQSKVTSRENDAQTRQPLQDITPVQEKDATAADKQPDTGGIGSSPDG